MKKLKIIVVENDANERQFIYEGFNESGLFEVIACVAKAGELFTELRTKGNIPDLILSDLNMPGKGGIDILAEMQSEPDFSHIPVVIMSTSGEEINRKRCIALGAFDYIVKPDTFLEYAEFASDLYERVFRHVAHT